jgi:formate dehydrogenase subunit gamma
MATTLAKQVRPWSPEAGLTSIADIVGTPGPVLRCLQRIQQDFGYVPADAVPLIADACNVSRAEVHGVLTFYSDLRTTPPPAVPVRLCGAEACQATGARELRAAWLDACRQDPALAEATGVNQSVACLGNCALGPAAMVDGHLIGRATVERILQMVADLGAAKVLQR